MESIYLLSIINVTKSNSLPLSFPSEVKESTKNGDVGPSTRFQPYVTIYAIPKIQFTM